MAVWTAALKLAAETDNLGFNSRLGFGLTRTQRHQQAVADETSSYK